MTGKSGHSTPATHGTHTTHLRRQRVLAIVAGVIAALVVAAAVYLNTYYHASDTTLVALASDDVVTVTEQDDGDLVFAPAASSTAAAAPGAGVGLIFYPGGKVDQRAYAPLMHACAERGFTCVLVRMPFNLAVFDANAADGEKAAFPEVSRWYLGGHSLGGAMAASYASTHADEYAGLLLCAAYSTKDLSATGLAVESVYGTADGVLNRGSYEKHRGNVPQMVEDVIPGGCHSYFGDYGAQDGDGQPTIGREEQMARTADDLVALAGR